MHGTAVANQVNTGITNQTGGMRLQVVIIVFLFGVTSSQISVFLPLVVQILPGVSPLVAGYFYVLRALAWTVAALGSAGLEGQRVRPATLLGPLVVTGGVAGQAVVVVDGSLFLLGGFAVLTGVGYGLCYTHLSRDTVLSDSSSSTPMLSA